MSDPAHLSSVTAYRGRRLTVIDETVRLPNGQVASLELIRHPGASAVVPFLTDPMEDDPDLLLIHQYRYATGGMVWEIPAGVLEPNEDPIDCAARELTEEAGAVAGRLTHLTTIYTTPGFTDERIHLFMATDLTLIPPAPEQDEHIEVGTRSLSQTLGMIRDGALVDAKSAVAIMYVAQFRDR